MFDNRMSVFGTAEASEELIDVVREMMRKHGPDRHTDGCEIIAEAAYQWCKQQTMPKPITIYIPPVTLADCPIGLFLADSGELCLKSEYGNNEGRIDAYIVSSGEFFWGAAPQTIASQRMQMVRPVDVEISA